MSARRRLATVIASIVLGPSLCAQGAQVPGPNDLRDFRIGLPVSELVMQGYKNLACAEQPLIRLERWSDYSRCPKDARGLREVSFEYDDSDNPLAAVSEDGQGTKISGQPVLLTLLIDDDRLLGLRVVTDPQARLFAHRRAYIFATQVKARYGEEGWVCKEKEPSGSEQPIGSTFLEEHCEKTTPGRVFILESKLYRDPARALRDFVSETRLTIIDPQRQGS